MAMKERASAGRVVGYWECEAVSTESMTRTWDRAGRRGVPALEVR